MSPGDNTKQTPMERIAAVFSNMDQRIGTLGREALSKVAAHIAALEADNAALFKALEDADHTDQCAFVRTFRSGARVSDCDCFKAIEDGPHPGAALLEEHHKAPEALRAVVTGLAEEMEAAIRERERPKGGQAAPFHGDFAQAPPSMVGRLRWWARELRGALAGHVSHLLVRARNEGLEEAARVVESADDGVPLQMLADEGIRSKKEPES